MIEGENGLMFSLQNQAIFQLQETNVIAVLCWQASVRMNVIANHHHVLAIGFVLQNVVMSTSQSLL